MGKVRINEIALNQGNHQPGDAISLGTNIEAVVIRNGFDSTQNLIYGWNQQANSGTVIPPGTSVTYERVGKQLDNNKLYIFWEGSSGGTALVTIYNSEEDCN